MGLNNLFGFRSANIPANESESLVDRNAAFALNLYARFKAKPGNLFFSPFSISTCLAMTYAGARGETERQMKQVLRFGQNQSKVHFDFGELHHQLNEMEKPMVRKVTYNGRQPQIADSPGIQLETANALWVQKNHPFLPDFLETATTKYQASVNQTDFRTDAETAANAINGWVAEKTNDKIQNILPRDSVDELTVLVLVNALYFKGVWANPFQTHRTRIQPFHLSKRSQVDVHLMGQTGDFNYTENKDFQAIELPYLGRILSLVILLPRHIDGCGKLENQLTPAFLSSALARMTMQKVEVYLPRFKLECHFDLKKTLVKMGMPDAFVYGKADLSGLNGTRELFISGIFHKAWGEINEEGTEAAAATAALIEKRCCEPRAIPLPVFRADHSFIFLIRDTRSGNILFFGRFADPKKVEP